MVIPYFEIVFVVLAKVFDLFTGIELVIGRFSQCYVQLSRS